MRTTYLNTILSLRKTNQKEVNINSYYRGLPTQCPTYLLSNLYLEQLSAAKTSGNGAILGKMSYSKIRVCLFSPEFLVIHISLFRKWTLKKKKKKKCLLDYFLFYSVILQNLHLCIKHNNLFSYIMSSQVSQNFSIRIPVITVIILI